MAEVGFWAYVLAFLALCVGLHHWIEKPLYQELCSLLGLQRSRPRPAAVPLRPSV